MDEDRSHALARGAFAFVTKPSSKEGIAGALAPIKATSARRILYLRRRNSAADEDVR